MKRPAQCQLQGKVPCDVGDLAIIYYRLVAFSILRASKRDSADIPVKGVLQHVRFLGGYVVNREALLAAMYVISAKRHKIRVCRHR